MFTHLQYPSMYWYRVWLASFPGPCPASHHLQYSKVGEGLVHFLTWVTSRTGQIMQTWASYKPQKTLPAHMHWSMTIPSWKVAAHEGAFTLLFTRQSGGQRVLPSQAGRAHSNNLVVLAHIQLKSFYCLSTCDITHVTKCSSPSPALPYCKRWEAWRGSGNEARVWHQHNIPDRSIAICICGHIKCCIPLYLTIWYALFEKHHVGTLLPTPVN